MKEQMKAVAEVLKNNRDWILDTWELRVKSDIEASQITEGLILRNILPAILQDMADIFKRKAEEDLGHQKDDFWEVVQESISHGRHRASSAHYTASQIIMEYNVLHNVIRELLKEKDAYSADAEALVSQIMEISMAHAIGSFSASLQGMREKLVSTLAHDIRNPLSAAYFALGAIKHEQGKERFETVQKLSLRSLKRAVSMIEGLLDAISVQAGEGATLEFREKDMIATVTEVQEETSETYANEVRVVNAEKEIKLIFDPSAIRRILENLIINALKYGAQGTPITIVIDDTPEEVWLRVHNEGDAIPKEEQQELFGFLEKSSASPLENRKSWGIGLSFVKMAAEAHGGQVELESNERGTTFSISIRKNFNEPGKRRVRINQAPEYVQKKH